MMEANTVSEPLRSHTIRTRLSARLLCNSLSTTCSSSSYSWHYWACLNFPFSYNVTQKNIFYVMLSLCAFLPYIRNYCTLHVNNQYGSRSQSFNATITKSHYFTHNPEPVPLPLIPTIWLLEESYHILMDHSSGSFPWGLLTKTVSSCLVSALLATCPAHLNLLSFVVVAIIGDLRKWRSSSLFSI